MKTKTVIPRRVHTKQISYQKMAEVLLHLQVEFQLLADASTQDKKVKATNFSTDNNVVFQFDDEEFSLSLDLVRKGGVQ